MIDNPKNILLYQATKKDIPIIMQLIRLLAEHHGYVNDLVATEERLEKSLFCEKPCAEVIIAKIENVAIGYMLFSFHFSTLLGAPTLYLVDLFIVPEKRLQGIGRYMLSHLAKIAYERDCGRIEWSVLSANKPAVDFYAHLGATILNNWKLYRISDSQIKQLVFNS